MSPDPTVLRPTDVDRLKQQIDLLASVATTRHRRRTSATSKGDTNRRAFGSNHRTRLSTDEFAFYMRAAPLSKDAFLDIVSHVERVAGTMPDNITLILASFPILGDDGTTHNAVIHAQSGSGPNINVFAKATASWIDPNYAGTPTASQVSTPWSLPGIVPASSAGTPLLQHRAADGTAYMVPRNNVVSVVTAGGARCHDVIDVCLDHAIGIGKLNLGAIVAERRRNSGLDTMPKQVSQVIVSRSIDKFEGGRDHNVGATIMHADADERYVENDQTLVEDRLDRNEQASLRTELANRGVGAAVTPTHKLVIRSKFGPPVELTFYKPYVMDRLVNVE